MACHLSHNRRGAGRLPSTRRPAGAARLLLAVGLLAALTGVWASASAPAPADAAWSPAGENRGVALEWAPSDIGQRAYRGAVTVCTDLHGLQTFVADASRLHRWIPNTEEAYALPDEGPHPRYYLRTGAPWPFKSRDMVYRLVAQPADDSGSLRITLAGEPQAIPVRSDAVRMDAARGLWILTPGNGRIHVSLELAVDAGRVPGFFANRRLAATVGGILANLATQFPCRQHG